ncbi:hypothetical protein [Nonomuraea sp. NPDC050643]|uniref:hypothetical protein n=1 Tax=Nonomuraea sp. NPDC050643 TaxID=3155660 RepID=UPI0033DE4DAC
MNARDHFAFAAAFAAAALVCFGATLWAVIDVLSRPFSWQPVLTVAFGAATTAVLTALTVSSRKKGRRAAEDERQGGAW